MATASGGGSELLDTWLYGGGKGHADNVGDIRPHPLDSSRDHTSGGRAQREGAPWPGLGDLS
jgi:hypothetical protein